MSVKIRWWGHSCFEIIAEGKSLVIDPHDGGSIGVNMPPPKTKADYVLITHDHYDHNAYTVVSHEKTVIVRWRTGEFSLGPFRVRGVKLPHDEFEGRVRGSVVAYRIEVEELVLVHLSDLGRLLKADEAERLGPASMVFVPAGGVYTLPPRHALESAELLKADIAVPMHYWIPGIHLPLEPIDSLLRYAKKWRVVRLERNEVELSREVLPREKTILIFKPPVS